MKKLACSLVVVLLIFVLCACASNTAGQSAPAAATPDSAPSAAPAAESPAASSSEANTEDDLAYIKAKGELIVGITAYEPMNYKDQNGKLVGFDTEYTEALCAKLGVTPNFIFINWDTKEIELKAKTIDCIWNGLTVTEERKANMTFTQPYLVNEQVVVVRSADASKYTDRASLDGASVVAESGSAGEAAIKADLSGAVYTPVDSQAKALLEVKAGTADAAVIDATMAASMTGEGTDYADLTAITSMNLTAEEYAIGLRVGSTAAAEFNRITDELLQDGTLAKIAEKYGLSERLITK